MDYWRAYRISKILYLSLLYYKVDRKCWVVYFQTSRQQPIPANELIHQSVVKFVSQKVCRSSTNYNLNGNVFCGASQDHTVTECLGDTGGPVMVSGDN